MAFEGKPVRVVRKENNSGIDKIYNIVLTGPNIQIIKAVNIDVPKPYFEHNTNGFETYFVGKGDHIKPNALCEVITKALRDADSADVFKDAKCIEFYREDDKDIAPKIRAIEFHKQIYAAFSTFKDDLIIFSIGSWPTSHMDRYNNYPYAEYFIFKPNKERGIESIELRFQK